MRTPIALSCGLLLLGACAPAPVAVPLVVARGGEGRVSLSWGPALGADRYLVSRGEPGAPLVEIGRVSKPWFLDASLPPNTTYAYSVQSIGPGGDASPSPTVVATTAPAAPGNLLAAGGKRQVTLSWDRSAGARSYLISRGAPGELAQFIGETNDAAITDTSLADGATWVYSVRAVGDGDPGAASDDATAVTAPPPPAALTAAAGGGVVALVWEAALGAASYRVSRQDASGAFAALVETTATSATDITPPAALATYRVLALNAAGASDASALAQGDARQPALTAESFTTWVSDGQLKVKPDDLDDNPYRAFALAADGSWSEQRAFGSSDGHLVVPGIAPGQRYLLQRGRLNLTSSANPIDLSEVWSGRSNLQTATKGKKTGLLLTATGLEPWDADYGWLSIDSLGGGDEMFVTAGPAAGTSSLSAFPITLDFPFNGLIDGKDGDVTWISQAGKRTSSAGLPYAALTRAAHTTALAMADGQMVPLSVQLEPAPLQSAHPRYRRSAFKAFAADVSPRADRRIYDYLLAAAQPQGNAYGVFSGGPELLWTFTPDAEATDVDWGEVVFGNPFPADWALVGDVYSYYRVTVTAPGAQKSYALYGIIEQQDAFAQFTAGPVGPGVSPPRSIRVNNQDARDGLLRGVGTAPEISWDPPSLGSPTSYDVHVWHLSVDAAGATQVHSQLDVRTARTSVRLPPAALQAGEAYAIALTAELRPGTDFERAPGRETLSRSAASAISAVLVP